MGERARYFVKFHKREIHKFTNDRMPKVFQNISSRLNRASVGIKSVRAIIEQFGFDGALCFKKVI